MIELQIGCTFIVCLYLFLRLRTEPRRAAFMGRFATLMAASWLAENTCIHLYGFYSYDPSWFGFIDQVPILIIAIWPVVIHSAFDVVSHRGGQRALRVALIGGLVVLSDASLIEPIAVRSGLWVWHEPGLFEVPPIGIIGWSIFATVAMYILAARRHMLWLLIAAPLLTHVGLLALWWGLFRHINGPIDGVVMASLAWVVALAASIHLARAEGPRPPLGIVMLRAPGASFFVVLLAIHASDDAVLSLYAGAFAVPWLVHVVRCARQNAAPRDKAPAALVQRG